ncbi:uncharacterized protein Tco025E_05022 [Trypanosoma conorhini]|uniref:FYVE-type domain-containing protein n=1 Tax=Trypanosoma conorhini TaxID=83891 RepID=A0A3S5IT60_9TRYP|nr:uncharacterized protein Tco025E_05022 [Trypanosoma conorhini]RNF16825.1 hypothetical protein Tco025E_05022 [Trypanosoma conorhini]
MGATVTAQETETAEAAVFDGVVPLDRKAFGKIPQLTFCPDCGRLFDVFTRPRRCRVCGEALCKRCCLLCRNWKWRPICAYCMDSCLCNYAQRTCGDSFDEAHRNKLRWQQQGKKTSSCEILRSFFINAIDAQD